MEKGAYLFHFFCSILDTMSVPIPTTEPAAITTGDTISWQIALPDYPASGGWTLKYTLVGSAGAITIASAASGADHLISITAATSTTWIAGRYQLQKYVEKGSGTTLERITLGSASIEIIKGLAGTTTASDTRSQSRRILDAINAAIEGRAPRADLEYEISTGSSTRKIKSMTVDQLLKAQQAYTLIVWREQNPGKLCPQVRLSVGGHRG